MASNQREIDTRSQAAEYGLAESWIEVNELPGVVFRVQTKINACDAIPSDGSDEIPRKLDCFLVVQEFHDLLRPKRVTLFRQGPL